MQNLSVKKDKALAIWEEFGPVKHALGEQSCIVAMHYYYVSHINDCILDVS